jgi:hypothetical protein
LGILFGSVALMGQSGKPFIPDAVLQLSDGTSLELGYRKGDVHAERA